MAPAAVNYQGSLLCRLRFSVCCMWTVLAVIHSVIVSAPLTWALFMLSPGAQYWGRVFNLLLAWDIVTVIHSQSKAQASILGGLFPSGGSKKHFEQPWLHSPTGYNVMLECTTKTQIHTFFGLTCMSLVEFPGRLSRTETTKFWHAALLSLGWGRCRFP